MFVLTMMRKLLMMVFLLGPSGASAAIHSMKYFYTASSGVNNFPEFVTVGMVDDQPFSYYDSNIKREVPKQDWMTKVIEGDPQYLERNTEVYSGSQQIFKGNIGTLKQRFNQTGGVHIVQVMLGCEWDDKTDEVKGFWQDGYDGEDFITFDLQTQTWVAPNDQAFITKNKWDKDRGWITQNTNYLTQICPEWGKKYLDYGRSSLMRTVLPSVSFLQKSPSSPVTCHATGFYPNKAMLLWRKDGEELHEDVEGGEVLPNHDGSFQMSADLHLSSVQPEDWGRYDCVFQLSGVNQDTVTKLDRAVIRSNSGSSAMIGIIVAAVAILALITAGVGVFIYKKKSDKRPPSPVSNPEVMEQLNPSA